MVRMSIQQLEATLAFDLLDFLITFEELNFSVLEELGITNHVPERPSVVMINGPAIDTHPATCLTERFVELANNEIIGRSGRSFVTTNVHDIRGTKGLRAFREAWSETHPPSLSTPRDSVARSEEQIAANEDTGAGPERTEVVVIGPNPNVANRAMRPDMETFIGLVLEGMFVVVRFELTDGVGILGFVSVLWFAFFGDWIFSLRTTWRFVTFAVLVTTFLQATLDFAWVETALS
jgi:hypothetical protein